MRIALLVFVLSAVSCLPGEPRGVDSTCDLTHPCRAFLRCSAKGLCEVDPAGPKLERDAAVDAPALQDATDDGSPDSEAIMPDAGPDVDASEADVSDRSDGMANDAVASSLDWTCRGSMPTTPLSAIRRTQKIVCHDESEFCDLPRGVAAWPTNSIPVCVLNSNKDTGTDASQVERIRLALDKTWSHWLPVTFTGWQSCQCAPPGSIALFVEGRNNVSGSLGFSGEVAVAVRLGTDEGNLSERAAFGFGRALGLIDHPDHAAISTREILRGQRTYGVRPPGRLLNATGQCLTNSPTGPKASRCEIDAENQGWILDPSGRVISVVAPHPCLSQIESSSDFEFATCSSPGVAKLGVTRGTWRAMGNLCVRAQSPHVGASMTVVACDQKEPLGQWDFLPGYNSIRLSNSNLCVTSPADVDYGTRPELRPCVFDRSQQFSFRRGHIIGDSLCFNVGGGLPVEGQSLIFWDGCDHGDLDEDKLFFFEGPLETSKGCVNASTSSTSESPVSLGSCVHGQASRWEYRW